jgi:DNA-binding MarR family transcriptional regulator
MNVKVRNTRNIEQLGFSLIEVISFLSSPQRDDALLREANVDIDRALFPLLIRLGAQGALSVVELADQVGRDHTTISRQLAKLESLALIDRCHSTADRRCRDARLTDDGRKMVAAITSTRARMLTNALADWSDQDCTALAGLLKRFSETLQDCAGKYSR